VKIGARLAFIIGILVGIGMDKITEYAPPPEALGALLHGVSGFLPPFFPYAFATWFMGMGMLTVTILYYRWFWKKEG